MAERPYTLLSCGISLDGYLDGATETRLLLSNEADFDRVDAERAASDAILVGAATVRNDNPRLLVRTKERQEGAPGQGSVWVTDEGDRDRTCVARRVLDFFATGDVQKLVYCASAAVDEARDRLARSPRSSTAGSRWTWAGSWRTSMVGVSSG